MNNRTTTNSRASDLIESMQMIAGTRDNIRAKTRAVLTSKDTDASPTQPSLMVEPSTLETLRHRLAQEANADVQDLGNSCDKVLATLQQSIVDDVRSAARSVRQLKRLRVSECEPITILAEPQSSQPTD